MHSRGMSFEILFKTTFGVGNSQFLLMPGILTELLRELEESTNVKTQFSNGEGFTGLFVLLT